MEKIAGATSATTGIASMKSALAMLAVIVCGALWTDGPIEVSIAGAQQQSFGDQGTGCVSNLTGAMAIAFTGFGIVMTHSSGGAVAALLVGAYAGHYLIAPLVCEADPAS